jgi:hypothetical protein
MAAGNLENGGMVRGQKLNLSIAGASCIVYIGRNLEYRERAL